MYDYHLHVQKNNIYIINISNTFVRTLYLYNNTLSHSVTINKTNQSFSFNNYSQIAQLSKT